MKGLDVDWAEAEEVYQFDQDVEHDTTTGVLEPKKELIARKMSHTGTREKKTPTAYKFKQPPKRKANATKGGLVAELAEFIPEHSQFAVEYFQIPSKEGKISFKIGDKWYTWALTEHRKPPAWVTEGDVT